jgi:hypothetical protein
MVCANLGLATLNNVQCELWLEFVNDSQLTICLLVRAQ